MRHAHTLLLGFASSLVAVVSCSGNTDLFVKGVLAPPTLDIHSTDACVYAASASSAVLSSGVVDGALASEYTPAFLVGNTGSDRIAIDGATVRLVDVTGTALASFTTAGAGSVDPGSGSAPSYGALSFHLVDQETLSSVAARAQHTATVRILAYVTVHGKTSGGDSRDTPEVMFPVDVCRGCLVGFPADSVDPTKPAPNCAAAVGPSTTGTRPCVVGQDQVADCRLCQGDPVCTP